MVVFKFSDKESRFKKFSEDTSIHGFKEFYYSKSNLGIAVWGILIFAALALTGFHICRAVFQYINDPSSTVVSPTDVNGTLYPKIRTCYMHWMYWVDWKTVLSLNYSKPSVLYALSFLSVIYSSQKFSIEEARLNLTVQMNRNNVSTMSEFYKSIAKKFPLAYPTNWSLFTEIELVHKSFWGTVLCYSSSSTNFENHMNMKPHGEENEFTFGVQDQSYAMFEEYVTKDEYNHAIVWWLYYRGNYVFSPETPNFDLTHLSLPFLFYIDAYSDSSDQIMYDYDWYKIDVSISAHRWKNTPRHKCNPELKGVLKNQTDIQLCEAAYQIKACTCPYFDLSSMMVQDTETKLCPKAINFLDDLHGMSFLAHAESDHTKNSPVCPPNVQAKREREECLKLVEMPCEVWSYRTTASFFTIDGAKILRGIASKNVTELGIYFPISNEILISIEVTSHTFEDFVGNVGGVLGIWTGASVLSFIQMFYFCCCWSKKSSNTMGDTVVDKPVSETDESTVQICFVATLV